MKLRKHLLKRSRLYLILDKPTLSKRSLENIYSALRGKIGLIQLRDKQGAKSDVLDLASKLSKRLKKSKTLFIVNDYVDVAIACGADGLHLGQDDLSVKEARRILGKDKIIGVSCHNLAQALKAQSQGADYIGIGPIYSTPTKPEYKPIGLKILRQLKGKIKIPYFAIGNIHSGNITEVVASGAGRIAVCRPILKAADPKAAAKRLYEILK